LAKAGELEKLLSARVNSCPFKAGKRQSGAAESKSGAAERKLGAAERKIGAVERLIGQPG
jgi:hypothetical protein